MKLMMLDLLGVGIYLLSNRSILAPAPPVSVSPSGRSVSVANPNTASEKNLPFNQTTMYAVQQAQARYDAMYVTPIVTQFRDFQQFRAYQPLHPSAATQATMLSLQNAAYAAVGQSAAIFNPQLATARALRGY